MLRTETMHEEHLKVVFDQTEWLIQMADWAVASNAELPEGITAPDRLRKLEQLKKSRDELKIRIETGFWPT